MVARLYDMCKSRNDFVFDNDEVKNASLDVKFRNHNDVTKLDTSAILPGALVVDDIFAVHLGNGRHKFARGIENGYHKFEPILDRYQWNYRPGILDNINTSESNILSVGYNQRIIHDFLYADITAAPKVYGAHRTFVSPTYRIGNDEVESENVQVEIDFTAEFQGTITIFEAKNGLPDDFNVFQLFNPFQYYLDKTRPMSEISIECCYLLRHDHTLRLYLYLFEDSHNPGSITLKRSAEYELIER